MAIDLSALGGEIPNDPPETIELLPHHIEHLTALSGLTPEIIQARGIFSATRKTQLKKLGFSEAQCLVPAIVFPIWGLDRAVVGYQIKPDKPRIRDDKPIKYETPKGWKMRLDIHPLLVDQIRNPHVPLWITEGLKKADSAIHKGLCCLALLGVQNWRSTDGPLVEWMSIALKGRRIYIAYDSDTRQNPNIQEAAISFKRFLESKGAEVLFAIPPSPDGRKVGLDDYFLSGGKIDDLVAEASPHLNRTVRAPKETEGDPQFPFTDLGNAERLIHYYGKDMRYCAVWNKWLFWSGKKWSADERGDALAHNFAQRTARDIQKEAMGIADEEKRKKMFLWGVQCEDVRKLNPMIAIARTLPGIPVSTKDLDAKRDLVNLQNGTFDLITGNFYEHRREDLLTCCIDASYSPAADCPQWMAFLFRAFKGDEEMLRFIWKAVGYSISGSVGEKCFFFLYGSGDNGKSVFIDTLVRIFGDYARSAKADTFALKPMMGGNNASSDIARLRESRFVAASETQDGSRLNEALMKDLTGGDNIVARFHYQGEFEFKPQFKIWMFGNHKPEIKDSGDAMWRRVKLIEFNVIIPKGEQDQDLGDKLYSERDGIISWVIDGCMQWRKERLSTPSSIQKAVQEYRSDSDVFGAFLEECTKRVSGATVTATALYKAYQKWAANGGQRYVTQTKFGRHLVERGEVKTKNMYGAIYQNLELVDGEQGHETYRGVE